MFIIKKWILEAVVDVDPVAAGLCIVILQLPPAIVCTAAVNWALLVVFSSCTVSNITESAWIVLFVKVNSKVYDFKIKNTLLPYIDNILASIAVLKSLFIIDKINNNFFLEYKIPNGRGNLKRITIDKKK